MEKKKSSRRAKKNDASDSFTDIKQKYPLDATAL